LARELVGVGAGGEGGEGGAERVDVDSGGDLAVELLGGHVAVGADHGGAAVGGGGDAYAAVVDEAEAIVAAEDKIAGLEVAVDDRRGLVVEIGEDLERLIEEATQLGLRHAAVGGEALAEWFALDQFADEEELAGALAGRSDR
jgi:hypothetical protein